MKNVVFIIGILVVSGCDSKIVELLMEGQSVHKTAPGAKIAATPTWYKTKDMAATLQFPKGWYENTDEHPYELQCHSELRNMTTGVFVYQMVDLSNDYTPRKLLDYQINDLMSKRKNTGVVEKETTFKDEGKTITQVVYSGDKGVSKHYYVFSLIEFGKPELPVLVTIQVAVPSQWKKSKDVLVDIIRSAKLL
ncbi:MAG: hypothetical protein JXX29_00555 [Deltaproteobacteria bacterium]|nr:hypothetical protein [Deltaproteobacteria bacterium]MBN2670127.1 hypothetical protein [Deltaproteobacteria bacterium]